MTKLIPFINVNFKALRLFLKSTSFSKALLVGVAVTVPILIGLKFDYFEIGLALCFGAFWSSPSDVSGSFRQKRNGILISAILIVFVSFIGGYLSYDTWLSLPVLGVLSFIIAYISIYGFRASLISFSGLLALVLSFAQDSESLEIYQYAILIGVGGLWYLLLTKILNLINPKAETEELLAGTFRLTSKLLKTRAKLIGPTGNREYLASEILKLQSELTESHQTLREILILSRKTSGWSKYEDKRLLIFIQLVEMLETAIANPVNYDRMDLLFIDHPKYIKLFQDLIFEMSRQLKVMSEAGSDISKLPKNAKLRVCFKEVKMQISELHESIGYEEYLMLQNLLSYQEKQFKKLKRIKILLGSDSSVEYDLIDRKTARNFLVPQDYDPLLLIRNLSFKSAIFRHSLRLSVTIMAGYTLGSLFPFQNPYWILLTIIVIMRPNYGLTKNRAKDRMIGTLIGSVIAYGIVFFVQDVYLFGVLGVLSLIIALSLVQKNARTSAIFITLSVVFIYSILSDDISTVIKFRILDTLVGAGLSYVAMRWIWPTWESVDIDTSIVSSIKANKLFFYEITEYYKNKGEIPTSYNIARKEAFLETSNLNSAFQRMAQDPKSKQANMEHNYELVVLNHNFLASLASLSAFIQQHKTTEASEQFIEITDKIEHNMELVFQCVNGYSSEASKTIDENNSLKVKEFIPFSFLNLDEIKVEKKQDLLALQEAHLVGEQLQWLFSISSKMLKLAADLGRK